MKRSYNYSIFPAFYRNLSMEERARWRIESNRLEDILPDEDFSGPGEYCKLFSSSYGATLKQQREMALSEERQARPHIHVVKRGKQHSLGDLSGARLITKPEFIRGYSAVAFANSRDVTLNTHVIISWSLLGIKHEAGALGEFGKFLKNLQSWVRFWSGSFPQLGKGSETPIPWLYCHEVGRNLGFHTHILTHIPAVGEGHFTKWCHDTLGLRSLADRSRRSAVTEAADKPKPLYIDVDAEQSRWLQWDRFQYMCKGSDADAVMKKVGPDKLPIRLGDLINRHRRNPGGITGKYRLHASQNVGPTRRKTAGFRSLLDKRIFDVRDLYEERPPQLESPAPLTAEEIERELRLLATRWPDQ